MDNRLIDVAIGLALVFALTSLLTTAVQEAWSQMKGKRGLFLQKALVSFLGDDNAFALKVMQHPLLVSLAPQTKANPGKPSYIEASSLVPALLGHLIGLTATKVRPASPQGLIELLQGKAVPQEFLDGLVALSHGVENDWPAFEARLGGWWDAVNERASGWFKRDVQLTVFVIGVLTAAAMNINPITVATRLWNDEGLRAAIVSYASGEQVAQLAARVPAPAIAPPPVPAGDPAARLGALSTALQDAIAQAPAGDNALTHKRLVATLERVLNFKKSLAQLPPAQWSDLQPSARLLLDDLPRERLPAAVRLAQDQLVDTLVPRPPAPAAQAPAAGPGAAASAPEGKPCRAAEDASLCAVRQRAEALEELQRLGLPIGWSESAQPQYFHGCPAGFAPAHLCWWGNRLVSLLGWLIVGLACTLGAPFWFDALSRLVRLRASGDKPQASSAAPATAAPPVAAAGAAPAAPLGPVGTAMHDATTDAERALTEAQVRAVQRALLIAEGDCSGWFDGKTRLRIQAWQDQRQPGSGTGSLNQAEIDALLGR